MAKLRNAFENISSDVKLTKAQISKITHPEGFLGALLSKLAGPLMKVAVQITKNVLVPLRLTAVMSAIDETT